MFKQHSSTAAQQHFNLTLIYQQHPSANMTIQRVYAFKVANDSDIPEMVEAYKALEQENQKVRPTTQLSRRILTQYRTDKSTFLTSRLSVKRACSSMESITSWP